MILKMEKFGCVFCWGIRQFPSCLAIALSAAAHWKKRRYQLRSLVKRQIIEEMNDCVLYEVGIHRSLDVPFDF